MKIKIIILCFCIFLVITTTNAKTLKAGIIYSVNEARIEAFTDIPTKIDIQKYSSHFVDPNYAKNMKAINKNKLNFKDRYINFFSSNRYCVTYKNKKIGYYYDSNGQLSAIEIDINNGYPIKSVEYNLKGEIESVRLTLSPNEGYVFDLNRNLIAHWIGDNGYDENGQLIMTRN